MDKITNMQTKCIDWTRYIDEYGYGRVQVKDKWKCAHRVEYEKQTNSIIPKGMVIDHLCRNRKCINVFHMEVVTPKENILRGTSFSAINARKTHCIHGHKLSGENLMIDSPNRRFCKTCNRERQKKFKRKKRIAKEALKAADGKGVK